MLTLSLTPSSPTLPKPWTIKFWSRKHNLQTFTTEQSPEHAHFLLCDRVPLPRSKDKVRVHICWLVRHSWHSQSRGPDDLPFRFHFWIALVSTDFFSLTPNAKVMKKVSLSFFFHSLPLSTTPPWQTRVQRARASTGSSLHIHRDSTQGSELWISHFSYESSAQSKYAKSEALLPRSWTCYDVVTNGSSSTPLHWKFLLSPYLDYWFFRIFFTVASQARGRLSCVLGMWFP